MNQAFRIIIFLLLLLLSKQTQATHLMGGEITWQCQGNGNYIFTLKLYRDCTGNALTFPINLRVHNHPSVSTIAMGLISQTDITPHCTGPDALSCAGNSQGAIEEFVLRSNSILLSGTPPPEGWIFTFDNCCRNGAVDNLIVDPFTTGFTLRAIMYPLNGLDTYPCFDSSPVFAQRPAPVICAGNAFTYNHNAYDEDNDSLVYSFAPSLDWLNGTAFTPLIPPAIPYDGTYTVNSPFPGPGQSGSIPASLNTQTGEISFLPNITGNFVAVVRVSSYRCGQLIAEVFREIQIVVIGCGTNNPPIITAPFNDPVTGLQTSFTTTVQAGDMVNFTMTATDNEFLFIGLPQTINVTASGGQFGTGFTNPNSGCSNPPCATLNPAPPVILANNQTITFNWQTSCDHVPIQFDCYVPSSTHTFVITFQDDFCPATAYQIATVSVIVTAPPILPPPSLRCVDVQASGDVQLSWIPVADPDNLFNSYHIFSSTNPNGPFTVVDSIFVLGQTTYTDVGANANNQSVYYYIRTRSGCGGRAFGAPSDTLQSIFLTVTDAGSGQIDLDWNPLSSPLPLTTQLPYRVDKELVPAAAAFFINTNQSAAQDSMNGCLQDIFYKVQIADASGCISHSNLAGGPFSNDEAPEVPDLDSITVNFTNNSISLGWTASSSADTRAYVIYHMVNGSVASVDTVYGLNSTNFSSSSVDPSAGPVSYEIAAIDDCNNLSAHTEFHSSIYLSYELFSCLNRVDLFWTAYAGWLPQPDAYQIYQKVDAGNWVLVGSVSGATQTFSVSNLTPEATYCYYVRAVFAGTPASSTSTEICFDANVQDLPAFAYLRKATVLSDGTAYSKCFIDTASDIASYRVLRADYPGGAFSLVHTGPIPPLTAFVDYHDFDVTTYAKSYTYKYELIDKCDNASGQSNTGRTILLQALAMDGFVNRLNWNSYAKWDADVDHYSVYRSVDGGTNYQFYESVQLDSSYLDVVANEVDTLLEFCYYIQAIEQNGNQYNFRDTSTSNRVCVIQKPTIYIPSAFRPGNIGTNSTFKPVGLYEKLALDHEFMIYNRWGEQLFYTKDTQKAWDGKYLSAIVPNGIYVFRIRFKLPDGSSYDKRGAVMVLD
ncbi:MAG TPA: gliding motility-associated C-terminal domain-containing protein [Flavobacteriales bacterium]|nr:gliding motility-associated C-terminal domain-containing protein [Flavobacteriales bacterium]